MLLGIPWPALRGPLRSHFWKKKRPQPDWGEENSGNALEPSNAFIGLGGLQPFSLGEFQEKLWERFRKKFRNSSGISSGKFQPYWGYGPCNGGSAKPRGRWSFQQHSESCCFDHLGFKISQTRTGMTFLLGRSGRKNDFFFLGLQLPSVSTTLGFFSVHFAPEAEFSLLGLFKR